MANRNHLRRHAYLESLLEDTDTFLGGRQLSLVHADSSFLLFDPRVPNPWLSDGGQVTWLLSNQEQIQRQGRPFMGRLFGFPTGEHRTLEEQRIFRATVKAVLHLQMYEGVRVAILPTPAGTQLNRLNFSLLSEGHFKVAWPAWHYYGSIQSAEARRATGSQLLDVLSRFSEIAPNLRWLAPYRPEHFARGIRVALPGSWRAFLHLLHGGRCADCNRQVKHLAHVDHMRPLTPEESPYHRIAAGNSVLFNLSLLCSGCNLSKSNTFATAPEELLGRIAPHPSIFAYLKRTLSYEPGRIPHSLDDRLPPAGEENVDLSSPPQ